MTLAEAEAQVKEAWTLYLMACQARRDLVHARIAGGESVISLAKELGVSRARIYQLLKP